MDTYAHANDEEQRTKLQVRIHLFWFVNYFIHRQKMYLRQIFKEGLESMKGKYGKGYQDKLCQKCGYTKDIPSAGVHESEIASIMLMTRNSFANSVCLPDNKSAKGIHGTFESIWWILFYLI